MRQRCRCNGFAPKGDHGWKGSVPYRYNVGLKCLDDDTTNFEPIRFPFESAAAISCHGGAQMNWKLQSAAVERGKNNLKLNKKSNKTDNPSETSIEK